MEISEKMKRSPLEVGFEKKNIVLNKYFYLWLEQI